MKTSESLLTTAAQLLDLSEITNTDTFLDTAVEVDSFVESQAGSTAVRHTAIIPEGFQYEPLLSSNAPVRCEYPFKLDRFQELALQCLERDESQLVSAHTSAGKTLIAEYAIHLSIERKQRVIYTSPIKALSNQKYRELNEKFGDVGLMTGDVTLNPDSTCIVMTTEILRNMIYKGTEILRETHFVVFDEVHYMRDRERGVVWEETIILLPHSIRFIFLSATIPNAVEFARWIVSIHKQPCHVIYTEKRPTPLEHYIYTNSPGSSSKPSGSHGNNRFSGRNKNNKNGEVETSQLQTASDKIFMMVDKDGHFQTKNIAKIQQRPLVTKTGGGYGRRRELINVVDILQILQNTNNLPAIIFSFRRKECEVYAMTVEKEFDFNTPAEKELIETIFSNALNTLREEDRKLPQIAGLKSLLLHGIGVHHSGLMPIVKEIIEILFQENLLKVLFATETFSIGLNMPAKAVVFTSIKKFDGVQTRFVTSGEYIQMSGRAGRRGTDRIGNVILAVESTLAVNEKEIKKVLHGPSNTLDSAFRLSYNTILNILRLDGMDEEYVVKHSFLQFRQEMHRREAYMRMRQYADALRTETEEYTRKAETYSGVKPHIEKYVEMRMQMETSQSGIISESVLSRLVLPGRIVNVSIPKRKQKSIPQGETLEIEYTDILYGGATVCAIVSEYTPGQDVNIITEDGEAVAVPASAIRRISKTTLDVKRQRAKGQQAVDQHFKEFFQETKRKNRKVLQDLEFYTPQDLGISREDADMRDRLDSAATALYDAHIRPLETEDKEGVFSMIDSLSCCSALRRMMETLSRDTAHMRFLIMVDEYHNKMKILQALSYVSNKEVLIKGKVASEISSGDELLLTEMLFNNEFSKLSPGRICSLLSCVVFDEKSDRMSLTPESESALKILIQTTDRLVKEFERLDANFKAKEYTDKFCCNLMDVVYRWTEGYSFAQICETTEVFEGSVIRCFRRLEEVLKEMSRASKVIGNVEMENKFSAAISLVKRDIVFANSLYL